MWKVEFDTERVFTCGMPPLVNPALWALELLSLVSCRAVDLRVSDGDKLYNLTAAHWCFWIDCAVLVPLETRFTDGRGWDNQKGQVWTTGGGPECFQELASLRVSKKLVAWSEIIRIINARENLPGSGPVSSFLGMIWRPRQSSSAQALPRGCRC